MPWSSFRRLAAASLALLGPQLLASCSGAVSDVPVVSTDSLAALENDEELVDAQLHVLALETPDNYHQTVHPDYAAIPDWNPRRYLVATPYAFSSGNLENPTLYAQGPDMGWRMYGENRPLVRPTSGGFLSDPDMVSLPDRAEMWIYYREVTEQNVIWRIRSTDGVTWGDRIAVVSAPNHMAVSPAVVRRSANAWMMYTVNAGKGGCRNPDSAIELRSSRDGIDWSKPTRVNLAQPGSKIWHIDVQWVESRHQYWALYNVAAKGSCSSDRLFLATSPDGVTWTTYPSPVLTAGAMPEFTDIVYRSTFSYNPRTDNIRFWFSGATFADGNFTWRTAYQRRTRAEVFDAIGKVASVPVIPWPTRLVPPLTDPP